jgi:hypothetical protein
MTGAAQGQPTVHYYARWEREQTGSLLQESRYAKNPLRLLAVLPAPIARAGPEGLHSRPVLHNAQGVMSNRDNRDGEEADASIWRVRALSAPPPPA